MYREIVSSHFGADRIDFKTDRISVLRDGNQVRADSTSQVRDQYVFRKAIDLQLGELFMARHFEPFPIEEHFVPPLEFRSRLLSQFPLQESPASNLSTVTLG